MKVVGEGQMIAGSFGGGRKVRAPQGRMVPNGDRGRPQGKCHREETACRCFGEGR